MATAAKKKTEEKPPEPDLTPDLKDVKGGVLADLLDQFNKLADKHPEVTYEEVAQVLRDSDISPE